ncbi:MAG: tyrosine-type recombinase/integrase [Dehalogenimonas sp.]
MRGHIVKRYPDSYTIVIELGKDPITGKRKQQWVSIKGTKKAAEIKLSELLHQLDTGNYLKPGKTTLKDFLEKWLDEYARPNLAPRTVEGYESIVHQHLIPKLGKLPLTQLKPEHIQRYYAECLTGGRCANHNGLNPLTVRHHHMVLHRSLNIAMKWGLINGNPADAIDPPHFQRAEIRIMGESDILKFLEAAKSTPYYSLFYLALFTGMRRSELLALRWNDIDLLLGQISVNRSLCRLHDKTIIFRAPKSAKGRRTIALSPSAIFMLREHRKAQEMLSQISGTEFNESKLVFSSPSGDPLLPDTVSQAWRKLASRLDLAGVRLHDARHSHASLLLKQGVHPKVVQERLGHATIQTTLDVYSHVSPGMQEAAALRFDQAFTRTSSKA